MPSWVKGLPLCCQATNTGRRLRNQTLLIQIKIIWSKNWKFCQITFLMFLRCPNFWRFKIFWDSWPQLGSFCLLCSCRCLTMNSCFFSSLSLALLSVVHHYSERGSGNASIWHSSFSLWAYGTSRRDPFCAGKGMESVFSCCMFTELSLLTGAARQGTQLGLRSLSLINDAISDLFCNGFWFSSCISKGRMSIVNGSIQLLFLPAVIHSIHPSGHGAAVKNVTCRRDVVVPEILFGLENQHKKNLRGRIRNLFACKKDAQ